MALAINDIVQVTEVVPVTVALPLAVKVSDLPSAPSVSVYDDREATVVLPASIVVQLCPGTTVAVEPLMLNFVGAQVSPASGTSMMSLSVPAAS